MKLTLTNPPNPTIPMNQMQPGQFAWCENLETIIFATWKAAETDQEGAYVALSDESLTWSRTSTIRVQLLPPGTQFTLKA